VGALACCAAVGFGVARADPTDLPNANLPGNSATLPNSNLPGPVTVDQPIMLPNTDSSGTQFVEAQALAAARAADAERAQHDLEIRDQTMRLAARAAEQSALARAAAADAQATLQKAVEQQQP
jgi:hypothetical protein